METGGRCHVGSELSNALGLRSHVAFFIDLMRPIRWSCELLTPMFPHGEAEKKKPILVGCMGGGWSFLWLTFLAIEALKRK